MEILSGLNISKSTEHPSKLRGSDEEGYCSTPEWIWQFEP